MGNSTDDVFCLQVIASSVVAPALGLAPSQVEVVDEGSEPDAFWAQIGGKKPYAEFAEGYQTPQEPRLFQVRVDSMRVTLEESHPLRGTLIPVTLLPVTLLPCSSNTQSPRDY